MCRRASVCVANRASMSPALQLKAARATTATVATAVTAAQASVMSAQGTFTGGATAAVTNARNAIASKGQRRSGVTRATLVTVKATDVVATNTGSAMTTRRTTVAAGTDHAISSNVA